MQIRKEETQLFGNSMTLYIENPKESTNTLIKLINRFSKIVGYDINI